MDNTITVIVEELFALFKGEAEAIGEAVCCDGEYSDEAREVMQCTIARIRK